MSYCKKFKISNLISKSQWWQKGSMLVLIISLGIINTGCDKENEIEIFDEYYIKYEVSSSTIYYGGKLDITLNTENDIPTIITIRSNSTWETIIGPVNKGFYASLEAVSLSKTYNQLRLYSTIYVSKNGSPFALKKINGSDKPRDSLQINYTIDY